MEGKVVSTIMLVLFLLGMSTLVFYTKPVKASGTIYIRANGLIDPETAPISTVDKVTYTVTNNVYDSIVIERDNIVLDGEGYTIQGAGSWAGIDFEERSNVTIKNVVIKGFRYGIDIDSSSNISIHGNNITNNLYDGIYLDESSHNRIFGNNITENDEDGIDFIFKL